MKQRAFHEAYQIWQDMQEENFKYNDFTISVVIQLYSALNMVKEANEIHQKYKFESTFINSCLIKMNTHHKQYDDIVAIANNIEKKDKVIYSQVIRALISSKNHIRQALDFMIETFEQQVYLRNTHYQRAIQVICQILKDEIQVPSVSKEQAKFYLSQLLEFIKGKPINLKSVSVQHISKFYFNEIMNVNKLQTALSNETRFQW